jgi:hypothetical protein
MYDKQKTNVNIGRKTINTGVLLGKRSSGLQRNGIHTRDISLGKNKTDMKGRQS